MQQKLLPVRPSAIRYRPYAPGLQRRIRLPCLDGLVGQFPILEALHHPIEIVCFGFELADGGCGIGGDEYFLSGFVSTVT
jgi:hypothetical protein